MIGDEMKEVKLIRANFESKVGIYFARISSKDRARLIEHIRMLDWVLTGGNLPIRSIEAIIKDYNFGNGSWRKNGRRNII